MTAVLSGKMSIVRPELGHFGARPCQGWNLGRNLPQFRLIQRQTSEIARIAMV